MRFIFLFVRLLVIFGMLRWAIGFAAKLIQQAMGRGRLPQERETGGIHSAGELRKDPVCGTFIPVDSSLKKTVNGESVYFCSADCRDRYRAA